MPGVPLPWLCPYSPSWVNMLKQGGAQEGCGSLLTSAFPAWVVESASLALKGENKAQSRSPKGKSETDQETHALKVSLCLSQM